MKAFSFNRFKLFAAKHYAENGRKYKFAIFTLLAIEVFVRIVLANEVEDLIANWSDVIYLMAYALMVAYCTKWSLGGMDESNNIVDMTLPVNNIERFAFAWLNSYVLGVLAPTFIFNLLGAEYLLPTITALTMAHALILFVACIGSRRAVGITVILFLVVVIGISSLFEQIDTFVSYGYGKFFSLLPSGNTIYMSNIYENAEGTLVYRWDIVEPVAGWVHLAFNTVIVLALNAAAYFKLRERRL